MGIIVNSFVRRQTETSPFSYFTGSWDELLVRIRDGFMNRRPGYTEGVVLVDLDVEGIFSGVVKLESGAELVGTFKPRRPGEEPRKEILAKGAKKLPAKMAYAVLYSSALLSPDGSNEQPPVEGNWELISLNASPEVGEMPISPETLMHNHFGSSGGTATKMTAEQFEAALRDAFAWWGTKAMAG